MRIFLIQYVSYIIKISKNIIERNPMNFSQHNFFTQNLSLHDTSENSLINNIFLFLVLTRITKILNVLHVSSPLSFIASIIICLLGSLNNWHSTRHVFSDWTWTLTAHVNMEDRLFTYQHSKWWRQTYNIFLSCWNCWLFM